MNECDLNYHKFGELCFEYLQELWFEKLYQMRGSVSRLAYKSSSESAKRDCAPCLEAR